jgi:membrane protein implicated in regulation of membrane protease activity
MLVAALTTLLALPAAPPSGLHCGHCVLLERPLASAEGLSAPPLPDLQPAPAPSPQRIGELEQEIAALSTRIRGIDVGWSTGHLVFGYAGLLVGGPVLVVGSAALLYGGLEAWLGLGATVTPMLFVVAGAAVVLGAVGVVAGAYSLVHAGARAAHNRSRRTRLINERSALEEERRRLLRAPQDLLVDPSFIALLAF